MESHGVDRLLADQAGVISRRQVLEMGLDDGYIRRKLRRRDWAAVHTGVYINHTGPLEWWSRAWAAVLFYWPAALCNVSSLRAQNVRTGYRPDDMIHVAVDGSRRPRRTSGIVLHRVANLPDELQPNRVPARVNLERSLVDVASTATGNDDAIAVLADACQAGRTTASRLAAVLRRRRNSRRRAFLLQVLEDVAEGAYSVLEHRYLTRVERPHGLPTAKRQRRVSQGRTAAYRDVEYRGFATVAELDGRLGHEEAQDRWDDLDRDIDSVGLGDITVRLGWRQVEDPCRTAVAVGRVLATRGWTGHLRRCSATCLVLGDTAASRSDPDEDAPPPDQEHAG